MTEDVEAIDLTEDEQILYFEGLGAIAHADNDLADEEVDFFKESREDLEVSSRVRNAAQAALRDPQPIEQTCSELRDSEARFPLYLDACEMAYADGIVKASEESALNNMSNRLGIDSKKAAALRKFAEASHKVKTTTGQSKENAKEALKEAGATVASAGVPIGAVAVSGSVYGLGAAGITSGLAALGLGLGMIPGLGMAVALGVGTYAGVKKLFG